MKFGKQLQLQTKPEWKDKYVEYNRLKRILARIELEVKEKSKKTEEKEPLSGGNPEDTPLLKKKKKKYSGDDWDTDNVKEFWQVIDENMIKINEFYKAQCAQLMLRLQEFEQIFLPYRDRSQAVLHPDNEAFVELLKMYETMCELRHYATLNKEGLRKIVKKMDKHIPDSENYERFVARLKQEDFATGKELNALFTRVQPLCSPQKLMEMEKMVRERRLQSELPLISSLRWLPLFLSIAVFVITLITPFPFLTPRAHRCFALLLFSTLMWVTEAIPYFTTAILIPVLVVFLDLLENTNAATGVSTPMSPKDAARFVTSHLVDHSSILILGGFAVSAAFCRLQIELHVASFFQQRLGKQPLLFLLAIMMLGLFLSMWIGNHTAPILVVSILMPIVHDFPPESRYVKSLLIGLAFACNFGGMMTPISSLQNILAVSSLDKLHIELGFGQWMCVSIPFCVACTILCWLYIIMVMKPDDCQQIPSIPFEKKPLNRSHAAVGVLILATIVLWAVLPPSFGDTSIVALAFMVVMFGTGILSTLDFNSFNWNLIFLIGGGAVLGQAVQQSQLLDIISSKLLTALNTQPGNAFSLLWTLFQLLGIVIFLTSLVSHTIASIILMPLLAQMGKHLGYPILLTMCSAFTISAAMALPFSSFPNLNSLLVKDDLGNSYLGTKDFLRTGLAFTIISLFLILTLGHLLISMFAPDHALPPHVHGAGHPNNDFAF